jgi:hypothetical protein
VEDLEELLFGDARPVGDSAEIGCVEAVFEHDGCRRIENRFDINRLSHGVRLLGRWETGMQPA